MIESIVIKNFLSHKKTKISFHPGVNIIVGESDTGKSAIVRALRWAITNRPGGDEIRSTWGGDTSIALKLGGSSTPPCSVTRMKGKGGNGYTLTREIDGVDTHLVFKAIKTNVPDEITEALNMDVTNLQTQFESHFLLSSSPGEVAQHFNKVAHLDKIDLGLVNIAREIRTKLGDITDAEAAIHRLGEEFAAFDDIEIIEQKVEALEAMSNEMEVTSRSIKEMIDIEEEVERLTKSIDSFGEEVVLLPLVDSMLRIREEILDTELEISAASNMIQDILTVQYKIEKCLETFSDVTLVDNVLALLEKVQQQQVLSDGAVELLESIELVETEIKLMEVAMKVAEDKFHKNIGSVCPLCGSKIK